MSANESEDLFDRLISSIENEEESNVLLNIITNVSLDEFIKKKQDEIRKHRIGISFDNDLEISTRWSRGKVFSLDQGTIFLTPTNLPRIDYLDLAETTHMCEKYYKEINRVPELYVEQMAKDHPLTDYKGFISYGLEDLFYTILALYLSNVKEIMLDEFKDNEILALLKQWNSKRFSKFLDFYMCRPQCINSFNTCCSLTSIMEYYCSDSKLIAQSFKKMCTYFKDRNFASLLSEYFINFMMTHLKISAGNSISFGEHNEWLASENLVERKFIKGDVESFKVLLCFKCPTVFDPQICSNEGILPIIKYWPRQIADSELFYSLRYYVHLTSILLTFLEISPARAEDLTECIRLLWKFIPTPIFPMQDIQEFFHHMSSTFGWEETLPFLQIFPPEFNTVYQPRSLLDLSRYTILQKCRTPEGIPSLGLPGKLQWYLELNSMETYGNHKSTQT